MRWKIFQRIKFLFRHSSNSRKLSQQKLHNEVACVFTPYYASKNADWNQQQRTVGGILANRNSANHPYCFLFNQKEVQILTFFCLQSGHDLAGRFGRVIPLYRTLGPAGLPTRVTTAVRRILAPSAGQISSSKEVRAWDISGFIEARDRDLNSVPYLGFTSLGKSGWISLSQVRTMKFSYVGVSSSSSVATSPWCDRPLGPSNVSSTKGHQSLEEILRALLGFKVQVYRIQKVSACYLKAKMFTYRVWNWLNRSWILDQSSPRCDRKIIRYLSDHERQKINLLPGGKTLFLRYTWTIVSKAA